MCINNIVALIPAFAPSAELIDLVRSLSDSSIVRIIVVNDGSPKESDPVLSAVEKFEKVTLLRHAVNLGKGAALKTGLNHAYCYYSDRTGVVTLDADGQHLVEDALQVADALEGAPNGLIIGVRRFDSDVPLRSKVGNEVTKVLFRLLVGQRLSDTQSGLRGIPMEFIPRLLKVNSNGYEFELDMLLLSKHSGQQIVEKEISTVYLEDNKSSHFNPFIDSMKIYFVLFRFILASSLTSVIDYSVFFLTFALTSSLITSQISARMVAMSFNYTAVKKLVFYSDEKHEQTFPKYAALVLISGTLSFFLISNILSHTLLSIMAAKAISELAIFMVNFFVQRDFIFTGSEKSGTDWDLYYSRPYKTATFTRKITEGVLHRLIRQYAPSDSRLKLGELGGANSCFYEGIKRKVSPVEYHVIDNNVLGMEKFRERVGRDESVIMSLDDVLTSKRTLSLDLVFSVGLIEHFSVEDTRKAILAHLKLLKPGGVAIISFPTPTFLYKASRKICELLGLWIFHDERPLRREEVAQVLEESGVILYEKVIWSILLTQRVMVARSK